MKRGILNLTIFVNIWDMWPDLLFFEENLEIKIFGEESQDFKKVDTDFT